MMFFLAVIAAMCVSALVALLIRPPTPRCARDIQADITENKKALMRIIPCKQRLDKVKENIATKIKNKMKRLVNERKTLDRELSTHNMFYSAREVCFADQLEIFETLHEYHYDNAQGTPEGTRSYWRWKVTSCLLHVCKFCG